MQDWNPCFLSKRFAQPLPVYTSGKLFFEPQETKQAARVATKHDGPEHCFARNPAPPKLTRDSEAWSAGPGYMLHDITKFRHILLRCYTTCGTCSACCSIILACLIINEIIHRLSCTSFCQILIIKPHLCSCNTLLHTFWCLWSRVQAGNTNNPTQAWPSTLIPQSLTFTL